MARNVYLTSYSNNNLSRHEMIEWVNSELLSNLQKIEEMGTGSAYCQLMNLLFPGIIPLKKMLQKALLDVEIDKFIPVEKLVKMRYQDNFEFIQWFKKFFDTNISGESHSNAQPEKVPSTSNLTNGKKMPNVRSFAKNNGRTQVTSTTVGTDNKRENKFTNGRVEHNNPSNTRNRNRNNSLERPMRTLNDRKRFADELKEKNEKLEKLEDQVLFLGQELENAATYNEELEIKVSDLNETSMTYDAQRGYYYNRLKEIEDFCLTLEEDTCAKNVLDILYRHSDEEDESTIRPLSSSMELKMENGAEEDEMCDEMKEQLYLEDNEYENEEKSFTESNPHSSADE
ncbi:hypothetical protein SNEBB_003672 [Seison nebaliae]|nr:hypothetical protein SNEBB_003672 [Seison nebaliae]